MTKTDTVRETSGNKLQQSCSVSHAAPMYKTSPNMKLFLIVVASAFFGGIAGYFVGVGYACSSPNSSNLCGLLGVFITGPLGALAGLVGSIVFMGRQRR